MIQTSLFDTGEINRDRGILKAVTHADKVEPGWGEDAYKLFKSWVAWWIDSEETFTIEEFRSSPWIKDLPTPPSLRAYGHLAVKAAKQGLIKKVGYTQVNNPKAHMATAGLWQKV